MLGEYNKNSAEPLRKFFEVQRETFFQTHTYQHTTMGFIADIFGDRFGGHEEIPFMTFTTSKVIPALGNR